MKAVAMFAAAMVMFAAPEMQAQDKQPNSYFSDASSYQSANIPSAVKAFESCLASENPGVQESAMAHLAMLKLVLPSVDGAEIARRLEVLSISASTASVRYKAYITSQVFRNPEYFASEQKAEYNNADELFNALAARLQSSILSYSGH